MIHRYTLKKIYKVISTTTILSVLLYSFQVSLFVMTSIVEASGSDANTTLLLHGDGADSSTIFTDESSLTHQIYPYGDVQISTATSTFGGAAMSFDGNGDYLTASSSPSLSIDSSDFTVDFWVYLNAKTNNQVLLDKSGGYNFSYSNWRIALNSSSTAFVALVGDSGNPYSSASAGNNILTLTGTTNPVLNTWYHFAMVKNGSNIKMYINGIEEANGNLYSIPTDLGSGVLSIGYDPLGIPATPVGHYFNGFMDELRISKGVARWLLNFSPPTQSYSSDVPVTTAIPSAQPTPTFSNTASFVVKFEGSMHSPTFTPSDVQISGASLVPTVSIFDDGYLSGDNIHTFSITVGNLAGGDDVSITIPEGAVKLSNGSGGEASGSNATSVSVGGVSTVKYREQYGMTTTLSRVDQPNIVTNATSTQFVATFSNPVAGYIDGANDFNFTQSDIVLTGSATATTTVPTTTNGTDYYFDVINMTKGDTVIVSIPGHGVTSASSSNATSTPATANSNQTTYKETGALGTTIDRQSPSTVYTNEATFRAVFLQSIVMAFTSSMINISSSFNATSTAYVDGNPTEVTGSNNKIYDFIIKGMKGGEIIIPSMPLGQVSSSDASNAAAISVNSVTYIDAIPVHVDRTGPATSTVSSVDFTITFDTPIATSTFTFDDIIIDGTYSGTTTALACSSDVLCSVTVSDVAPEETITVHTNAGSIDGLTGGTKSGISSAATAGAAIYYRKSLYSAIMPVLIEHIEGDPIASSEAHFKAIFGVSVDGNSFTNTDVTVISKSRGKLPAASITTPVVVAGSNNKEFAFEVIGVNVGETIAVTLEPGLVNSILNYPGTTEKATNMASQSVSSIPTKFILKDATTNNQAFKDNTYGNDPNRPIANSSCTFNELTKGIADKYEPGVFYKAVNISDANYTQCWLQENVRTLPNNGADAGLAWSNTFDTEWYGFYNDTSTSTNIFAFNPINIALPEGRLYQRSAAMENTTNDYAQGVCPMGWHIPSDNEWMFLEHTLGMTTSDQLLTGDRASGSVGTALRGTANNAFNALLGGTRSTTFNSQGTATTYWTSSTTTDAGVDKFITRTLNASSGVTRSFTTAADAYAVRCLKNGDNQASYVAYSTTLDKAPTQPSPTYTNAIRYRVGFSEPINITTVNVLSDINLYKLESGTFNLIADNSPYMASTTFDAVIGTPNTYEFEISGFAAGDVIKAIMPNGKVFNSEGIIRNAESVATATTSNIVTYQGQHASPDLATSSDTFGDAPTNTNTDNITSTTTPIFTGQCEIGDIVTLYQGATANGTTTCAANNTYTISVLNTFTTGARVQVPMAVGFTDTTGNERGLSAQLSLTVDAAAPELTVNEVHNGRIGASVVNAVNITGHAKVGIGAAAATTLNEGQIVHVTITDASAVHTLVATTTIQANGNWSLVVDLSATGANMNNGTLSIIATAQDVAGNTSVGANAFQQPLLDTAVPEITINPITGDNKINATEYQSIQVTGTSTDIANSQNITISFSDGTHNVTTITQVNANSWSASGINLSNLNDATDIVVTVTAQDSAGNNGTSTIQDIVKDISSPNAPSGASVIPQYANNGTPVAVTIVGVEAGATVTVPGMVCAPNPSTGANVVCQGTVGQNGLDGVGTSTLITVTDPSGNTNMELSTGLVVDNVVLPPTASTTPNPAGNFALITTTLTGVEEGAIITIPDMSCPTTAAVPGTPVICTGTVGADANKVSTSHDTITIIDRAGNTATVASDLVIDLIAPEAPISTTVQAGGDIYINAAERTIGVDIIVALDPANDVGDIVIIKVGNAIAASLNHSITLTEAANNSVTLHIPSNSLPSNNANMNVSTAIKDGSGNTSSFTADPQTYTVDTFVGDVANIQPLNNSTTTSETPSFAGSGENNALVTVASTGAGTNGCTATVSNGTWSCALQQALAHLSTSFFNIFQTDKAGNVSPTTQRTIHANLTIVPLTAIANYANNNANPAPTIQTYQDALVTGVSIANITEVNESVDFLLGTDVDTTIEIQKLVTALAKIKSYGNNSQNPAPTVQDYIDAHIVGVTALNLLSINTHVGPSVGFGSNVDTIPEIQSVVDSAIGTRPELSIDNPLMGDNIFNAQEASNVTLSGTTTAEQGQTVTVKIGVITETTQVDAFSRWSLVSNLSNSILEGVLNIEADVNNQIGTSALTATGIITKDTQSIFTVNTPLSPTDDTTPIISGTGENGASISVTDGLTIPHSCNTVVTNGVWECSIGTDLLNNTTNTFTVTQVDTEQNSAANTITIAVDTSGGVAPSKPPSTPLLAAVSDSATLGDGITNKLSQSLTIQCRLQNTVTLSVDGTALPTTQNCAGGNVTFNTTFTPGQYALTFTETNGSGTSPSSDPLNLVVDNTASAVTNVTPAHNSTTTSSTTIVWAGQGEPGAAIVVKDATNANSCNATASTTSPYNWTCTINHSLPLGSAVDFTITQSDLAGNDGASIAPTIRVIIGEAATGVWADVNGDGSVTTRDSDLVFYYQQGGIQYVNFKLGQGEQWVTSATTGDVNGDGSVTTRDADLVFYYQQGGIQYVNFKLGQGEQWADSIYQ